MEINCGNRLHVFNWVFIFVSLQENRGAPIDATWLD